MDTKQGIEVVEKVGVDADSPVALVAFPGIGMAGNIALAHIVDELGMKEVGHIKSSETPQVILVHKNRPSYSIRIYEGGGIIAILSELPAVSDSADELNEAIIGWLKGKKASRLFLLGGFPSAKRGIAGKPEKDKGKGGPRVYGLPSDAGGAALIKRSGLKPLREGAIFGEEGLLLLSAMEEGLPAVYIMADAIPGLPDPGAAAALIEALNGILKKDIDNRHLRDKGEEVKKRFNSLMDQTAQLLQKYQKPEKDTSPMYM